VLAWSSWCGALSAARWPGAWAVGAEIHDNLPAHGRRGPFCLGTTANGAPRHPLYVRGDQALEPWSPWRGAA